MSSRPTMTADVTCPVCCDEQKPTTVYFRPAGQDYGDPFEVMDVDQGCLCRDSSLVHRGRYDELIETRVHDAQISGRAFEPEPFVGVS